MCWVFVWYPRGSCLQQLATKIIQQQQHGETFVLSGADEMIFDFIRYDVFIQQALVMPERLAGVGRTTGCLSQSIRYGVASARIG